MINGKNAVVTGGSRGIGAAIVEKFASMGVNVAILYASSDEKAAAVRDNIIEKYGVKAKIYKCDVSSDVECADTVKKVTDEFGGIDILVNNAGTTRDGLIAMMKSEDFDTVINTNLKGCFNMIKACSRNFIKKKYGKIINISSVSGILGTAGQCNYASSKAGVIALTKVTAREFAGKNVCCNAIAPGFITTDMTEGLEKENYLSLIPLKRCGTPEDVANLAAFLADEASDYITGEVIRVDGGMAI